MGLGFGCGFGFGFCRCFGLALAVALVWAWAVDGEGEGESEGGEGQDKEKGKWNPVAGLSPKADRTHTVGNGISFLSKGCVAYCSFFFVGSVWPTIRELGCR